MSAKLLNFKQRYTMPTRSSREWDRPVLDKRDHIELAKVYNRPFNETINRFDPKYWVVDYNALMVATIIPISDHSFYVPAEWRTNADFLGVRWMSEDDLSHTMFKYATNVDYRGCVLAFRHNPEDPEKFTVTLDVPGREKPATYRLAPYGFNPTSGLWECLDKKFGTNRTYPPQVIGDPVDLIPEDEIVEAWGRKDYIFILDFTNLQLGATFKGEILSARDIRMISFDCVTDAHGLGKWATCHAMQNLPGNRLRIEVGAVNTNSQLTPGDVLQVIYRYWHQDGYQVAREDEFKVVSYEGFGTGAFSVICEGQMPGPFVGADAFYGRYLQNATPYGVKTTKLYFCDMKLTGTGHKTLGKRRYVQEPHGLGMTSGFDDMYNLTPERAVEMVYDLGYRDNWTKYIGMSHYFKARTAYLDKVTGEKIDNARVLHYDVLFCGESNAAVHFNIGQFPNRGVDGFQQKLTTELGIRYGGINPINGAVGSTAADRMCSVNPDSEVWDPNQWLARGGLWWWDLEADKPGPALLNAIKECGDLIPKAVVWCQGNQDAAAIAFPGNRVPVPSLARTKAATKKVFEYMRSLWGADLKIVIQEQGHGWGLTDPAQPNMPIQYGQPTFLDARRNTWGDVVFRWKSYHADPSAFSYRVIVFGDNDQDIIWETTVPGTQQDGEWMYADWPNEINVPLAVARFGDQFPWGFLRWRVVRADNASIRSKDFSGDVPIDNPAIVKKLCLMGINSLIGGYFNDLSDPLNHGGTGRPGRKDVIAASTFRKEFARKAGLRDVQVMPHMCVIGSSPINPMPYQEGFPLDNYWWDAPTNSPGPNLQLIDPDVRALGMAPSFFVESGPGETTGIAYAPEADRPAILAAWESSNLAMLAWMRANWGNPNLEIWFQGATTSFWGNEIPPMDVNAEGAMLLRNKQTHMALQGYGFKMGSYVPGANTYRAYLNEMAMGLGWVHYSLDAYHAAAREMGEAMALDINRALNPPTWTTMMVPANVKGGKLANMDIRMTWTARAGITHWQVTNMRLDTGAVISQTVVSSPEFLFTVQEQRDAYNADTMLMYCMIAEYDNAKAEAGPAAIYNQQVGSGEGLLPVRNLKAEKKFNGDIHFTWESSHGWTNFYFYNLDVRSGNLATIKADQTNTGEYIWTRQDQVAYYGNEASWVQFQVCEFDPSTWLSGAYTTFSGEAVRETAQFDTPTGLEAVSLGNPGFSDIRFRWDSTSSLTYQYRVRNLSVVDRSLIWEKILSQPQVDFTLQEQTAEYGFGVSNVLFEVMEYDPSTQQSGPAAEYNGQTSTATEPYNPYAMGDSVGNVTYSWAKSDGIRWEVEIQHYPAGGLLKSVIVTDPRAFMSKEENEAAYGGDPKPVMASWRVVAFRADGAASPQATFLMPISWANV